MPFVRSLKHACALEKFVFTPSTSSCVIVFSMCQLSAFEWPFWEVPVTCRFIESVLYNWLEELWTLSIIVRGQWLELVYICASERFAEWNFFLLFWCCYVWTKQTAPIHGQFIYLIFFFTVIQVACYLKDGGLTSLLTYVP